MHIPDGFVAPEIYIPSYAVEVLLVSYSFKRFKKSLEEKTIPYLASLSVFSFILMSIMIPIPGGTSIHGMGVASISLLFGPWVSFISISVVLFLQAVLLGGGGITTFPINALSVGFFGSMIAYYSYKLFIKFIKEKITLFLSGFLSTILSVLLIAIVLSIHPVLFIDSSGKPLYFPYGFSVVIPAMIIPHLIVGIIEGVLTNLIVLNLKNKVRNEG